MIESQLTNHDLQWCLRRAPKAVIELMKEHSSIIAGGGFIRSCIAGEKINDLDLFCDTKDAARGYATNLAHGGKVYETGNAFTVSGRGRVSVQFIHRGTFDTPQALLESFDFTIACGCFWYYKGWRSLCHERYYADLVAKRLIYQSPKRNEDAGGSLLRVLKFYQRGYRIPLDSMGAVIARLLTGVRDIEKLDESRRAVIITGLLREVDPAIDPTHIAHLPSDTEKVESVV